MELGRNRNSGVSIEPLDFIAGNNLGAVMANYKPQCAFPYDFSPASMGISNSFSLGGMGQE